MQARQTIERRVNELGVTEPSIAQQGANDDQILVQLPGVSDVNRAKEIIRSTGLLELKIVERTADHAREALLVERQRRPGMDVVPGVSGRRRAGGTIYLPAAPRRCGDRSRPAQRAPVARRKQPAGGQLHAEQRRRREVRSRRPARTSAVSWPSSSTAACSRHRTSTARITNDGRISGSFTQRRGAEPLADPALRFAAGDAHLPRGAHHRSEPWCRLDPLGRRWPSVVGLVMVVIFMLIYYKLSGVNAVIALLLNLVILLGMMAYIGAVMTLPGIAGFVLTMGIGVDSNVLIFERIKEELEAQRGGPARRSTPASAACS